jgi:hypothetical protein
VNSKSKGILSEVKVIARLVETGRAVSIPFGDNSRYDLVVEEPDGKLVRVQIKSGRLRKGCVRFYSCSTNGFTGEYRGYRGQVDVFMVYCPDNGRIYRVPVEDVGETSVLLRVSPPKRSERGCKFNWAKEFEF